MEATASSPHIDLSIKPMERDIIPRMCSNAIRLGFTAVGLTLDPSATPKQIHGVKRMVAEFKPRLDVFTRVEISPRSRRNLLKMLGNVRNRFEAVSVRCASREVALVAARDRRVDSLLFPCNGNLRMRAGVASTCRNLLEFELQPLIMSRGHQRRRCFLHLRRDLDTATDAGAPVAPSSGARGLLQQRSPLALSSILATLGACKTEAIQAIGPLTISKLQANRQKLSERCLEAGVHVTKRLSR